MIWYNRVFVFEMPLKYSLIIFLVELHYLLLNFFKHVIICARLDIMDVFLHSAVIFIASFGGS